MDSKHIKWGVGDNLGPELNDDPGLDDQASYWYTFGNWVWTGGDAAITGGTSGDYFVHWNNTIGTNGTMYRITYTITGFSGTGVKVSFSSSAGGLPFITESGTFTVDLEYVTNDTIYVDVVSPGDTDCHITYISVKEIL